MLLDMGLLHHISKNEREQEKEKEGKARCRIGRQTSEPRGKSPKEEAHRLRSRDCDAAGANESEQSSNVTGIRVKHEHKPCGVTNWIQSRG